MIKFIKYFLPKHKFTRGDQIRMANGDISYNVIGTYYTMDLKPVVMMKGPDGKLYTDYEIMYVYDDKLVFNESY